MPPAVRTALASSKDLTNDELAAEADTIREEFHLATESRSVPAVASLDVDPVEVAAVRPRPAPRRNVPPVGQRDSLCYIHKKFGVYAYSCKAPSTCPMRDQITPPPATQGNGRAGR